MRTLTASGDAGDFIVSLGIAKQLGCSHINVVDHHSLKSSFTARAHLVTQLAESQPYIEKVTVNGQVSKDNINVSGMRRFHQRDKTLMEAQRKEVIFQTGEWIKKDERPWLEANPHSYSWGRIVIARSERYRNDRFPWQEIVNYFGDRLLFVGIAKEHQDFESRFGRVEFYRTSDLFQVAEVIQGADMFIGNQSSPNAIAQGLGKTSVLEVSDFVSDCIYNRNNVTYFTNRPIVIEGHTFNPVFTQADPGQKMLWLRSFFNAGINSL